MKRHKSQIAVAVVCAILGFLLSYQYKELKVSSSTSTSNTSGYNSSELLDEVEGLKKEKKELSKKNEDLTDRLNSLEQTAASKGDVEKDIVNQLQTARMQLGLLSAKGSGIKITLILKSNMFSSNSIDSTNLLQDSDLVSIVNTLWFSKAEAISINDYRVTPQTGIKASGNYIWIGSAGRINPSEKIEIKAIGDTKTMKVGLDFQTFSIGNLSYYDTSIDEQGSMVIDKTSQSLRSDYVTVVSDGD